MQSRPSAARDELHTDPGPDAVSTADAEDTPDALLWVALSLAPAEGIAVADLVAATGMSQRWVHYQLRALAATGQAIQIRRGIWRAANRREDDAP